MTANNDDGGEGAGGANAQDGRTAAGDGAHGDNVRSDENASMTRRLVVALLAITLAVIAFAFRAPLIAWFTGPSTTPSSAAQSAGSVHAERTAMANGSATGAHVGRNDDDVDHWTCTMHPFVRADAAGKCPVCGMDLVPVTKTQLRDGVVIIDDARRQMIGVKTAPVVAAAMHATLRAAGRVAFDEAKLADVTMRVNGFVTQVAVNETGKRVHKGETLALVYSPDIYAAERDFLVASKTTGALVDPAAARARLRLLGVNDDEIDAVAKEQRPRESVAVTSPIDGVVVEKNAIKGGAVEGGARLFRIGAVDDVWLEADLYQSDLARIRPGDKARVAVAVAGASDPAHDRRRSLDATVATVLPSLDEASRTGRVRFHVPNASAAHLVPGMFVTVEIERADAHDDARLQIARDAVVYTGARRLVFVDLGNGQFKPREIEVGDESDGMIEVTRGLRAGEVVATSGVFLIAAEARISTTATYWSDDVVDGGTR